MSRINKKNNSNITDNCKSTLDEHQEQVLLKIEHNGCWFAFWGLLAAMAIQILMKGNDYAGSMTDLIAGEWIVFMCLSLYLAGACMKNGIWDRRLKPNAGTNLVCSLVAAAGTGIFNFLLVWKRYPDKMVGAIAAGVFIAVFTFGLIFGILQISLVAYKKRQKALEEEPMEDTNEVKISGWKDSDDL